VIVPSFPWNEICPVVDCPNTVSFDRVTVLEPTGFGKNVAVSHTTSLEHTIVADRCLTRLTAPVTVLVP
jgi:hypothetical protein